MEKIIESTKRAFTPAFIRLSPKLNELSEILWFVFRMGGSVSSDIITPRFPDAKSDLRNLMDMSILKELEMGTDRVVVFTEGFENNLLKKNLKEITASDIFDMLVTKYSKELGKRYKLDDLVDKLCSVLSAVVVHSSPEEPAFLNKVLRSAAENMSSEITPESLSQSKDILEYYLSKYLGLVHSVGSFAVNLSPQAVEMVGRSPELLEAYKSRSRSDPSAPKAAPKEAAPAPEEKK